jgi:RimJ/RimL family protein N-acetyltransferase
MDTSQKTFHTDRLVIREVREADIDDIHQLHSLPETDKYNTLGIPGNLSVTRDLVLHWLKEQQLTPQASFVFRIELKETEEFIGLIAIVPGKSNFKNAEVWYKIHVDHWKKGYTSEALLQLLNFGFNDLNLHRIEAGCAVRNIASIKVLEKTGMIREGRKRKNLPIRGKWYDSYQYAILDEEFKAYSAITG